MAGALSSSNIAMQGSLGGITTEGLWDVEATANKGISQEESSEGNGAKGAVMLVDAFETRGVTEAGFRLNGLVSDEAGIGLCQGKEEVDAVGLEKEQIGEYDPFSPAIDAAAGEAELEEGDNSGIWTEPIWYYEEDEEVCSAKRIRLN